MKYSKLPKMLAPKVDNLKNVSRRQKLSLTLFLQHPLLKNDPSNNEGSLHSMRKGPFMLFNLYYKMYTGLLLRIQNF